MSCKLLWNIDMRNNENKIEGNKITDNNFWENFWSSFEPEVINKNRRFSDLFEKFPNNKSFLEIGGFPGRISIYFRKFKNCDVSLLDLYINKEIVNKMEEINNLEKGAIKLIEADFLNYSDPKQYDMVFSLGFVEHFKNSEEIFQKHFDLLRTDGMFFIEIPNFLGLNGLIQKWIDPKNYQYHNLEIMDVEKIKEILKKTGVRNYKVDYYGKPYFWIDKSERVNMPTRMLFRIFAKFLKIILCFFPKNRFLSPYIIIMGSK